MRRMREFMNMAVLVNLGLVGVGAALAAVGAFISPKFRHIMRETYLPSHHDEGSGSSGGRDKREPRKRHHAPEQGDLVSSNR